MVTDCLPLSRDLKLGRVAIDKEALVKVVVGVLCGDMMCVMCDVCDVCRVKLQKTSGILCCLLTRTLKCRYTPVSDAL